MEDAVEERLNFMATCLTLTDFSMVLVSIQTNRNAFQGYFVRIKAAGACD
jgi:hypothetical protein